MFLIYLVPRICLGFVMSVMRLIGWIILRFTNQDNVSVIQGGNDGLEEFKEKVAKKWPGGWHFVFIVENNPGDKWIPEEYEEEFGLGLCTSTTQIWDRVTKLREKLIQNRTLAKDRHVEPTWCCVLIL